MRWLMIALAVVAFGLVGAGCGGGDDEASSDTDTVTITDTTETDDTTTDETTTDETDTDVGTDFDFASEDCQELVSASAALSQALGAAGSGDDLSDESQQFQEFADQVPEEIRADVQVLADAFAVYADALSGLDLQAGETPTPEQALELTQALGAISQTEVTEASERVSAWTQENCTG